MIFPVRGSFSFVFLSFFLFIFFIFVFGKAFPTSAAETIGDVPFARELGSLVIVVGLRRRMLGERETNVNFMQRRC